MQAGLCGLHQRRVGHMQQPRQHPARHLQLLDGVLGSCEKRP
jgi:hypothetical protein